MGAAKGADWLRQLNDTKDVSEGAIGAHVRVIVIIEGFVRIATALLRFCQVGRLAFSVELEGWL